MSNILKFPDKKDNTYTAKSFNALLSGLNVTISGTLNGFIDLSIQCSDGSNLTYSLSCDDARILAANLLSSVNDVQANCLFDKDSLLI